MCRRITSTTWYRVFLVRGPTIWSRWPRCMRMSVCWTLPAGPGLWRVLPREGSASADTSSEDLSAPMLTVARAAAAAEHLAVEWREGSAVELPMADASYDVAFCQQGLQFFRDRPTALREMYRVTGNRRSTGPQRLEQNRAKPGLCRARGSASAAHQSGGRRADDRWAIRSEQPGRASRTARRGELRAHHHPPSRQNPPLSVIRRIFETIVRWRLHYSSRARSA